MPDRFTLVRGQWYGLTMFPGYFDCPYHSPIRVDAVVPLGSRQFELEFLNLAYAAGVQGFKKRLKTLRRAQSHLVAEETEVKDRTYVIAVFNRSWLRTHVPDLVVDRFFDSNGHPDDQALLGLAATAY
jgi:hypothetical protein